MYWGSAVIGILILTAIGFAIYKKKSYNGGSNMAKYGNWFENAKEVLGKLASWSANGQEIDSDLTVTQVFTVEGGLFVDGDTVSFSNLRTTESGIAGELWSNNGVVTVSGS